MSFLLGITLTLLSICTISKALPDFHKQMSPQQLQSVFHVDSVAAVPQYEVVQLLHQHTKQADLSTLLQRRRRSINIDPSAGSYKQPSSHHVKKDLSKNPYFSKLKAAAASANSVHSDSKEHVSAQDFMNIRDIKEHNVSFSAFGENLNLKLRATQGLFKDGPHKLRMWTVSSEPNATHGLDMQEVSDEDAHTSEEIGELFQDEANLAAILMRRHLETGDLIMEGSIGHGMVIKPLPHELSPHKDQAHHIIYKRDTSSSDHMGDFAFMEPDDVATSEKLEKLQKRKRRSVTMAELTDELALDIGVDEAAVDTEMAHKRSKRLAPNIIYPEVLVIVDYDGYRLHGGDNLQVKRYFISFWNGVDLRYRLLKGPRIRISIAGIIISRGRDATPYLERNRVGRDAIDSAAALTDMGKYLFRERRLPVYDIAVAITKYDMCRRRKGGRCTKGTAGFAYVGGACVVNKRLEKVNSVAIIEDTGGFSGIIVAAHEVGHLLGAVHDGSPPPSYLGGPGAQRCRWEDGYIMSDLRHTERGFRWSPCTVQSFNHFLNGDTATCLHNAPHEDSALGRSLPGSLLSLDAQCRRDRGTYACFKDQRVCAQLFCFDAQTGYCVAYRPAAEGSSCGNGLNCLDGRCQAQSVNVIPDFGKQFSAFNSAEEEAENEADSSEEDDKDDDDEDSDTEDDEDEEDEDVNSAKNPVQEAIQNALNNLRKLDNSVEETSLEITDEKENNTKTTTTTTSTTPTPIAIKKSFDTFEYLARFLDDKELLQQYLLGLVTATKTTPAPTTTTVTPTTPITQATPATLVEQLKQQFGILIKTRTSSSTSSSSSNTIRRSSSKNSSNGSNSSSNDNNSSEEQQKHQNNTLEPRTIHTQQKQQNIHKLYSTDYRKQFQYYLNLLQKNSSNSYSLINSNKKQLQQRTIKQESSQTKNSNYSATNNNIINNDIKTGAQLHGAEEVDDVESNEALERRNRKVDVAKTTTLQQQQQQQQQQKLPTTIATTPATITPTRNNVYAGRSTPRTHTFFDAYFKKLQAINASQQQQQSPPTTITATVSSTTSISSSTSTSSSSSSASGATGQRKPDAPSSYDHFGGHFLKRTLSSSSKNSSRNSSSNKNNSSSINNNNNKKHKSTTTTAQPAYATNYLGDNSNNLPTLANVEQSTIEQHPQQQSEQLAQEQAPQPSQQQQQLKTQKFTRRQLIRTTQIK